MSKLSDNLLTIESFPPIVKYGVLYVQKKAVYIIELVEESSNIQAKYVTVYEVEPRSKPPIKAYNRVSSNQGFKETTVLGKLASQQYRVKDKVEKVVKPPLFMAEITSGIDTFTRKQGRGFYEREKDSVVVTSKGPEVKRGNHTGVFINLDSITWEKAYVAPSSVLKEFKARQTLWFDL